LESLLRSYEVACEMNKTSWEDLYLELRSQLDAASMDFIARRPTHLSENDCGIRSDRIAELRRSLITFGACFVAEFCDEAEECSQIQLRNSGGNQD